MVPVETRAFGLLAVCVILLATVLLVQRIPARAASVARPVMLLIPVVVIVLGILVLIMTAQ
jgi:hypothetical protein